MTPDGPPLRIAFLDVEASGLVPGSYPVEIGYALPRALPWGRCAVEVGSVLVRPERAWLARGGWDPDAEAVHGLSREALLRGGLPAGEVCDLLDRVLGGRRVVTDTGAGSTDDEWLAVLYEAAGRGPAGWRVAKATSDEVVHGICLAHGLRPEIVADVLLSRAPRPTHAAGEDALSDAWRYAAVQQLGRLGVGERSAAGQRAALRNPERAMPAECWPVVVEPHGGYRRRAPSEGPAP